MNAQLLSAPVPHGPALAAPTGLVALLDRGLTLLARRRAAWRDHGRLLTMTEHELSDIGLTRDDVLRAKPAPLRLFAR